MFYSTSIIIVSFVATSNAQWWPQQPQPQQPANAADLFGLDNYLKALGITDPLGFLGGCQREKVSEQCARDMLQGGAMGQFMGSNSMVGQMMGAFGVSPEKISQEIQVCKDPGGQKATDLKSWIDVLLKGGIDTTLETACRQQICAELRNCEQTLKNMCGFMNAFTNPNQGNALGATQWLTAIGQMVQEGGARNTAKDACQKLVEMSRGQSKNPVQELLNIFGQGAGTQVAGGSIKNPTGAAQTFGEFGRLVGGGQNGMGSLLGGGNNAGGLGSLLGGGNNGGGSILGPQNPDPLAALLGGGGNGNNAGGLGSLLGGGNNNAGGLGSLLGGGNNAGGSILGPQNPDPLAALLGGGGNGNNAGGLGNIFGPQPAPPPPTPNPNPFGGLFGQGGSNNAGGLGNIFGGTGNAAKPAPGHLDLASLLVGNQGGSSGGGLDGILAGLLA